MARNSENTFPKWLQYFDIIGSTNNYAMHLVEDGLAHHGKVIWAGHQSMGKGQRGKKWENHEGNIMMSLIVQPKILLEAQFMLSVAVSLTIAQYLQSLHSEWQVAIKWPNDIFINDKKTCGILIENVLRGMDWTHAIIGMGINVNQEAFGAHLLSATSMRIEAGRSFELTEVVTDLRAGILNKLSTLTPDRYTRLLAEYNQLLFRKGQQVSFHAIKTGKHFDAFVQEVLPNGRLVLLSHVGIEEYNFGELAWV